MSRGGNVAVFVGAILVSFALGYFVLPLLQPGRTRQTIIVNSDTYDELNDADALTFYPVENMSTVITTSGSARLHTSFSALIYQIYATGYVGSLYWRIALVIAGIGNNTGFIGYSSSVAIAAGITFVDTFYLEYDTDVLPAATYNVTVYWLGSVDAAAANLIYIPAVTSVDVCRTLTVQEISA